MPRLRLGGVRRAPAAVLLGSLLTVAGCVLLAPAPRPTPQAVGVFWEDTFENRLNNGAVGSRDQTQWDTSGCGGGFWGGAPPYQDGCNAIIDSTVAHSGTHSLRSDYANAAIGACGKIPPNYPETECGRFYDRYFPDTSPEIWVRYWHRWINHVEPIVSEKHLFMFGVDPFGAVKLETYIQSWHEGQMLLVTQTHVNVACENGSQSPSTECLLYQNVGAGPVVMNDGAWHCIEVRFRTDSSPLASDGIAQGWIDGTLVVNYTHSVIAENVASWNMIRHFTQQGGGTRWTDDLAVGSTRIGCGGTVLPPPTPNAPPSFNLTLADWLRRLWASLSRGLA